MKAINQIALLTELGASIDLQNRMIHNLRKIALQQDVVEHLQLAKSYKNELEIDFVNVLQSFVPDHSQETFSRFLSLKNKYAPARLACAINYQM